MDQLNDAIDAASPLIEWLEQFAPGALSAVVILIVGWIVAAWAGRSIRRLLERAGRLDPTLLPIIGSTIRYALLIIVIVAALGQLGIPTTSILAALGAAGLAIGLALQGTLANIAAGLMLLWLRPFRSGDFIDANGISGSVREVGLFATELETYDGIYRFVPNSELWNKPIYNYARNPKRMADLVIGIGYGEDIAHARHIMLELARSDERVVADPAPIVFVGSLDDSAVTLHFRAWINTPDYWGTMRYLLEETKRRLDEAEIEIPFPQRVVHTAPSAEEIAQKKANRPRPDIPDTAETNLVEDAGGE